MDKPGKWKKITVRILIILAGILVLLTLVASPLTKYLVQKYDEKFTGREITLGRAIVNPLAGSVGLRNFKIHESESDTIFFSAAKFSANISILKLINGVYDISSIQLNRPEIRIVKDDSIFNFNDLIEKFLAGKDTLEEKILKLNIRNIKLNDGTVFYIERDIPADTFLFSHPYRQFERFRKMSRELRELKSRGQSLPVGFANGYMGTNPRFYLTYVNLCEYYNEMENYDQALQYCNLALDCRLPGLDEKKDLMAIKEKLIKKLHNGHSRD